MGDVHAHRAALGNDRFRAGPPCAEVEGDGFVERRDAAGLDDDGRDRLIAAAVLEAGTGHELELLAGHGPLQLEVELLELDRMDEGSVRSLKPDARVLVAKVGARRRVSGVAGRLPVRTRTGLVPLSAEPQRLEIGKACAEEWLRRAPGLPRVPGSADVLNLERIFTGRSEIR